ncbi:hypothetical protein EBS02_12140 [bacterium]|nr:hypothetical protein [bacterium]
MSVHREIKKVTTNTLLEMKRRGEKISMLTAYDYTLAKIIDDADIDVMVEAAAVALAVGDPELAGDKEKLEDVLDLKSFGALMSAAMGSDPSF